MSSFWRKTSFWKIREHVALYQNGQKWIIIQFFVSLCILSPFTVQSLKRKPKRAQRMGEPKNIQIIKHKLLFDSQVSELKMKFAVVKGIIQFYTRKYLGEKGHAFISRPIEVVTDEVYNKMN
jgi:hypothetical protein